MDRIAAMDVEQRALRKTTLRIVPFFVLCYFVAYLDRVNVGFAAPSMSHDLHLSATAYGFGAGIFFLTYFLFEVPSNLLLTKFGARKWIARIMVSWGLLSASMAFVSGAHSFYLVRLLLGIAEAGFFPGVIFYLTLWFPKVYRARIIGFFIMAIPLSSVIGAPVSSAALALNGTTGFRGWQWLFLIEGVPSILLGILVFYLLSDKPEDAVWLKEDEKNWLLTELRRENAGSSKGSHDSQGSLVRTLLTPRILLLGLIYFGATAGLYALSFYLPTIVKGFGLSLAMSGWVIAVPYALGTVSMALWSRHSDSSQERKWHAVIGLLVAAAGLILSTVCHGAICKMVFLSVASMGIFASLPVIWTLPSAFMSGPAAAGGIAVINSLGNLSGFSGTYAVGWLKDRTGSYASGLILMACLSILSAVLILGMASAQTDGTRLAAKSPDF